MRTSTATYEPRVWVGCLACYNGGNLNGEWLDGPAAVEWKCANPTHEETWCFDIEGVPSKWLREMSPMHFAELAEAIERFADHHAGAGAIFAYLENEGGDPADLSLDDFDDAFAGEWESVEDYAENFAEDCGMVDANATWPLTCIDWERAARDLVLGGDIYTVDSPNGVYVFHNV